ncbi:MAG: hypothetical protein VB084_16165 [Syntrophomonadaceae bacterium]|nr:hypothetical protein [Syntrophomonadaceae bacterium]
MYILAEILKSIKDNDTNYDARYKLVFQAVCVALENGLQAGVRMDESEPEWPVLYIELPTGQVSWHMPQHIKAWDGHDTEEKYRRINEFIKQCL